MKKYIAAILLCVLCAAVVTPLSARATEAGTPPEGRFGEIMESYSALPDKDKDAIFKQDAKIRQQIKKLMDEYAKLGVITQEEADAIAARFETRSNAAREHNCPVWLVPKAGNNLPDDPEKSME